MKNRNQTILKIALTAVFAALSYIAFMHLQIPLPGGTALHIGNALCVLCALLLGGGYGGFAGSIGMTMIKNVPVILNFDNAAMIVCPISHRHVFRFIGVDM